MRASLTVSLLLALFFVVFGLAPSLLEVSGLKASASGGSPQRTLSLEERVRYQRAVEEVYWRHTIWPKENSTPKPRLDEVSPLETTRGRVEDVLRKSDALGRQWGRAVTGAQLQAEVARMARETRQPALLRELWQALDNDPLVIAEVLARPALVERLARTSYASDDNFHGALRATAEAQLRAHTTLDALRRAGGKFTQVEAVRVARKSPQAAASTGNALAGAAGAASKGARLELTATEWEAETARLKEMFGVESCETCGGDGEEASSSLAGGVSSLQEDENSFYVTSVVESGDERVRVARVEWAKTSFDAWWSEARAGFEPDASTEGFDYQLAEINQVAVTDDTWTPTKGLPEATGTAVWTGTEMIVWGGGKQNSGARYNPATDTWTPTSATNVPSHRSAHTAVWTGTEMIVWGGCERHFDFCGTNDGGRYNPVSDTWTPTSIVNAPTPRSRHLAVWTGSKMIVWAGVRHEYRNQARAINSGGVYDPASDSWTTMNTTNAPAGGSSNLTAVWTGAEMITFGGLANVGGRYNPDTNTWTQTNPVNAPSPRTDHTAVWTGSEMIVWGGITASNSGGGSLNDGGRYNPATDTWTPISTTGAPGPRYLHTAVWTGTEMIVWGGSDPLPISTGGRYNPSTDSWTPTSTANAPPPKSGHVAVWTGELMIVWSVTDNKTGGRYNPANNTWTPTDNNDSAPPMRFGVWTGAEMIVWFPTGYCGSGNCPSLSKRYDPATYTWRPMSNTGEPNPPPGDRPIIAVWTGTEMIVWGVNIWTSGPGEGGRYNPQTDSWRPVTTNGAPIGRSFSTGVWTGSEMIVWGGQGNDATTQNTGGRYNPSTDTWRPTSTTGAPEARYLHTALWTGSEMIVWGGTSGFLNALNSGGRYNPSTDTWTPTSTAGAPEGRWFHTAVWTGTEMIVWGGRIGDYNDSNGLFNTGGRYNPSSNTWTPTSTTGAPTPRFKHSAVWTGELMIVWGGIAQNAVMGFTGSTNTGGSYRPQTDSWTPTSTLRAPGRRHEHLAFWTGTGMLVWGGYAEDGSSSHGGYYFAPGASNGNTPPAVRITAPSVNARFDAGSTIQINAEASDSDGTVASVNFYANDTLLGTDSEAPYSFAWNRVRSGNYAITASANDNSGGVTRSAPVQINVEALIGPPNAVVTSPADMSSFVAPATIRVAASVQPNPDYDVTKVEFWLSEQGKHRLVHTDTTAPYGFDLTNQPEGTYIIYAFAYDGHDVGLSPGARYTVTAPAPVRTNVALAANGATASASSTYSTAYPATAINNGDRRGTNWGGGGGWNDATAGQHPDWVEIAFSGTKTIDEVDIFALQDNYSNPSDPTSEMTFTKYGITDFEVRYWDDAAANWLTIAGTSVTANNAVWRKLNFSPVTTTKIRVIITGALNGYSRLAEVEAWQQGAAPTPTPAPRLNVALASQGATTLASSTYSTDYAATAINNGDRRGTGWGSGGGWNDATQGQYPDWVEVTFAGAKTIDEVDVFMVQDNYANPAEPTAEMTFTQYGVTDFAVQYWDGANWIAIPGASVTANGKVWSKFTFSPVTTTKIRVVITNSLNGYSRLAEVEAWQPGTGGTTPSRPNLALASNGATVVASSEYSSAYPVAAVNNGDRRGTGWGGGGGWNDGTLNEQPDWVEVRFSGAKTLSEVNVFSVQDNYASPVEPSAEMTFTKYGVTDFQVQYWDGANWVAIPGASVAANGKVWSKLSFSPVTTERIRVVVTGALGGYSRITEIEAYE